MSFAVSAVAGAILMLGTRGGVSEGQANYAADAITRVAGDDLSMVAALAVTGSRESGFDQDVGRCLKPGMGGWGYFQLADEYWSAVNCAGVLAQTRGAMRALRSAGLTIEPEETSRMFGLYIGARAKGHHPEARARAELFWATKERVTCSCCI